MRHLELGPKDLLKVNRTKDEKKKRINKLSKRQLKQVSISRHYLSSAKFRNTGEGTIRKYKDTG